MSYADQLKNPRWQKKRLEILERDGWTCQTCGDTEATLTVHHKSYRMVKGKFVDVWDYNNQHLVTMCESCHSYEEMMLKSLQKYLFFNIREYHHNTDAIMGLNILLDHMNKTLGRRITHLDISKLYQSFDEGVSNEG